MGIYIIFLAWGNSLGPLCGGFIIDSKFPTASCTVMRPQEGLTTLLHAQVWDGGGSVGSARYLRP
jgi:hypothetical protein